MSELREKNFDDSEIFEPELKLSPKRKYKIKVKVGKTKKHKPNFSDLEEL